MLITTACNTTTPAIDPSQANDKPNLKAAAINVKLGLAYLQKGHISRAKKKLLIALNQGPKYIPAYEAMAYYYDKTGQFNEAEQYYTKALSLNYQSGKAQNNYGAYLCSHGQYRKSLGYFLNAVKDPHYLTTSEAYENAGLCALLIPDRSLAKQYFNKALAIEPERANSLLEISQIYFNEGDIQKASANMRIYENFAQPTAESLWLKYRIARKQGDKDGAASAAIALKGKFANSKETSLLLNTGKS